MEQEGHALEPEGRDYDELGRFLSFLRDQHLFEQFDSWVGSIGWHHSTTPFRKEVESRGWRFRNSTLKTLASLHLERRYAALCGFEPGRTCGSEALWRIVAKCQPRNAEDIGVLHRAIRSAGGTVTANKLTEVCSADLGRRSVRNESMSSTVKAMFGNYELNLERLRGRRDEFVAAIEASSIILDGPESARARVFGSRKALEEAESSALFNRFLELTESDAERELETMARILSDRGVPMELSELRSLTQLHTRWNLGPVRFIERGRDVPPDLRKANPMLSLYYDAALLHQQVATADEFVTHLQSAFEESTDTHWKARKAALLGTLQSRQGSRPYQIEDLHGMDGRHFEQFLERLYSLLQFETTTTPSTGDQGADLILGRGGRRIAVQAKRYTGAVGNKAVQEAAAARGFYGTQEAWVVTNSTFTASARALSERINVVLVDGPGLIEQARAGGLLITPADEE